jgi:Tol biopolymer transport system component
LVAAPELIQPGVISTDVHEAFPAIDPVDGSLWFSVYDTSFAQQTIMRASRSSELWAAPEVASFSGTWSDRAPRFTPDGSQLYFTSDRPLSGDGDTGGDLNIWVSTRLSDGGWSEPVAAEPPINAPGAGDMHASVARDGTIYFASDRVAHSWEIYRLRGGSGKAEPLPGRVRESLRRTDLLAGPKGDWLVLVVASLRDGPGDDLLITRWRKGEWTAPRNVGPPLNSREFEYGPSLSPDGRWLFFTSHRRGSADVYRVLVSALGIHE